MAFWIFKVSAQELYPDVPGQEYVYDNTHSVRVKSGDVFLYLDKRNNDYAFTATGDVVKVSKQKVQDDKRRNDKVKAIYTAHLANVTWFTSPLSISPIKASGRENRSRLGIEDVNLLGWSQSIPSLSEDVYQAVMDLAQAKDLINVVALMPQDYSVEDSFSVVKKRVIKASFQKKILERHNYQCAVCGTSFREVLQIAHISSYATDKKNRANPANGICLCGFCHPAFDRKLIAIQPDGELLVNPKVTDEIALKHFYNLDKETRCKNLSEIESTFLIHQVEEFKKTV